MDKLKLKKEHAELATRYVGFIHHTIKPLGYTWIDKEGNKNIARNEYVSNLPELFMRMLEHDCTDIYTTIHNFNPLDPEVNEGKLNMESLRINTVAFDFDIKEGIDVLEVLEQTRKMFTVFESMGEHPMVSFSGCKGFHIRIPIQPVSLMHPKEALYSLVEELHNAASQKGYNMNSIDDAVTYDINRILRVPNTINSKTGMWCIPLLRDELFNLGYDEMCELASHGPRVIPISRTISEESLLRDWLLDADLKSEEFKIKYGKPRYASALQNYRERVYVMNEKTCQTHTLDMSIPTSPRSSRCPMYDYVMMNGIEKGNLNNCIHGMYGHLYGGGTKDYIILKVLYDWSKKFGIPEKIIAGEYCKNQTRPPSQIYSGCCYFLKFDEETKKKGCGECPTYKYYQAQRGR